MPWITNCTARVNRKRRTRQPVAPHASTGRTARVSRIRRTRAVQERYAPLYVGRYNAYHSNLTSAVMTTLSPIIRRCGIPAAHPPVRHHRMHGQVSNNTWTGKLWKEMGTEKREGNGTKNGKEMGRKTGTVTNVRQGCRTSFLIGRGNQVESFTLSTRFYLLFLQLFGVKHTTRILPSPVSDAPMLPSL